jgi:hypothetical protein
MYCHICGVVMSQTSEGQYYCEAGGMELSLDLNRRLTECYVIEGRQPKEIHFDFAIGAPWFCPGCGERITQAGGRLCCSRCRRDLGEFVYALIEHCYHAPWPLDRFGGRRATTN